MKFSVINLLENGFERLGRLIARRPYIVVTCCLLFTGLCSIGFLNLKFNSDVYEIWDTNPTGKPGGSQAVANQQWVEETYVDDERVHTLLISATKSDGNILTPTALQVMLERNIDPIYQVSQTDTKGVPTEIQNHKTKFSGNYICLLHRISAQKVS